jgi:hypothetical protein
MKNAKQPDKQLITKTTETLEAIEEAVLERKPSARRRTAVSAGASALYGVVGDPT